MILRDFKRLFNDEKVSRLLQLKKSIVVFNQDSLSFKKSLEVFNQDFSSFKKSLVLFKIIQILKDCLIN